MQSLVSFFLEKATNSQITKVRAILIIFGKSSTDALCDLICRYYFEEMEQEIFGNPKSFNQKEESPREHSSISEEEEDAAPLWWEILLGILRFGIEASNQTLFLKM